MRRRLPLWFGLLVALGAIVGTQARAISPLPCSQVTIHFDFDSAVVGEQTRKDLAGQFECLGQRGPLPLRSIVISGSADLSETVDPIVLSTQRAEAVRDYFISRGLPGEVMEVTTLGDAKSREWYGWTHRELDPRNDAYRSVDAYFNWTTQ